MASSSGSVFTRGVRVVLSFAPFCTALLVCGSLHAQTAATATIAGRVQDPASGDYLGNARVVAVDLGRETLTDSTGYFRLSGLPAGQVRLRVTYLDFEAGTETVAARAGEIVTRDISMQHRAGANPNAPVSLAAFVVATSREMDASGIATAEQRYAKNLKTVLAADAFGDISENNVGEFLKRMPGVTVNYAEGDAASISLRGFGEEHTGITVDGNSIASAASSNPSRLVDLETLSVANASRLEVIKSVLPNQWANSLGGSVNLVSKSSFERSRPLLSAQAVLQFTNDDHSFKETPGPGSLRTRKVRPGGGATYIHPINKDLGFTVSANYSDQFGRRTESQTIYEFTTAAGASEAAPYLRSLRLNDNPRETVREAYSAGVDWRPVAPLKLSANYQYNTLDLFTAPRFVLFNTGATPLSYDATQTIGRVGAGTAQQGSTWTHKTSETHFVSLSGEFRAHDWKIDAATAYSYSDNRYRNVEEGFFRGITTRINAPTVRFTNASGGERIADVQTLIGTGTALTPVDWTRLANYRIIESTNNERRDGWSEDKEVRLNVRRELDLGRTSAAVQVGGAVKVHEFARKWSRQNFSYRGPDNVANSADDSAGGIRDTVYGTRNYRYGWPDYIEWPDLYKFYDVYEANPGYFVRDVAGDFVLGATADDGFKESLSAAYAQGEVQLFNKRLLLIGGVRFERTENSAYGYKVDQTRGLQFPAGSLERTMAQNIARGTTARHDYEDLYPSIAATVTLRENLLLRLSYSGTIGRPDLVELIPRITETDADVGTFDGTLNARNPALKPWSADNYDISLEYYFNPGGLISVGGFRKFIRDPFGAITAPLTPELANVLGYDYNAYSDYRMVSRFNLTESSRITGLEVDYRQSLGTWFQFARGLEIYANGTLLDLDGPRNTDFGRLYPKSANWGFNYTRGRVRVGLGWNYNGGRDLEVVTGAARRLLPRTVVDLSSNFQITKRFSLLVAARNLTNATERIVADSPLTPAYSDLQNIADFNVKWTVGLKARF